MKNTDFAYRTAIKGPRKITRCQGTGDLDRKKLAFKSCQRMPLHDVPVKGVPEVLLKLCAGCAEKYRIAT